MSECERARARVCDLITKGLQQALLLVLTQPLSLRSAWRSYRPYRYEIVIDMQSDDSDTASGHKNGGTNDEQDIKNVTTPASMGRQGVGGQIGRQG